MRVLDMKPPGHVFDLPFVTGCCPQSMTVADSPWNLSRFLRLEHVGKGYASQVFMAVDIPTRIRVALKVRFRALRSVPDATPALTPALICLSVASPLLERTGRVRSPAGVPYPEPGQAGAQGCRPGDLHSRPPDASAHPRHVRRVPGPGAPLHRLGVRLSPGAPPGAAPAPRPRRRYASRKKSCPDARTRPPPTAAASRSTGTSTGGSPT